ncbi:MAG: SUMF1/EgtB/PvdO family nonheme iron enzyme [Myxococcales bacterium]|nr:SUMF1/EgtB/PvdO family nonheme iron enzyme [Myxococcales bacterium]MBL0196443.1 SUMF1/EgtB/PvdO family nonheme iron enzyme [Myxococcales bacterium]HQY63501.1 SUMF1/EgtB/PvdO family nonheme iron enzyme [Polyangiaceae bacterium]
MHRRALGPLVVASLVGLVLAPLACSSGGGSLPSAVTNTSGDGAVLFLPPGVVIDAAVGDATPDTSTAVDAQGDAPSVDLECKNGKIDPNETDVDCGGPKCNRCADGKRCVGKEDCLGGFCDPSNKQCSSPTCSDGVKNGDETDVDCGGTACVRCGAGRRCTADGDCKSLSCNLVDSACACPARMVTVPKATGGAYCIDETEVTKGDYDKFLRANVDVTRQDGACRAAPPPGSPPGTPPSTGNTTFVPNGNWPPPQPLSTSYGLPVTNVDWCDAAAYCTWAGKVLCGDTSGAAIPAAEYATAFTRADKDAWYNACSAQGANAYPYGPTYMSGPMPPAPCNTSPGGPWLVAEYADTGSYTSVPIDPARPQFRSCQGGVVGLFHMSGNVAEWENSCDGTALGSNCRIRGGSYDSGSGARCDAADSAPRDRNVSASIGIRCCQF